MAALALTKFLFLARLVDQPKRYSYQVTERCLEHLCRKTGACLSRYIKFRFSKQRHCNILDEWNCAKADLGHLYCRFTSFKDLFNSIYWKIYKKGMPIDYILGWTPFMGMRIGVKPLVLIPRSDTEHWLYRLVEEMNLDQTGNLRVLEVGSGTGCISIALAKHFPQNQYLSIDTFPRAIRLARINSQKILGSGNDGSFLLKNTIKFEKSDIFSETFDKNLPFDIIVSNPPYIPRSNRSSMVSPIVRKWESSRALIGGMDCPFGARFHQRLIELASRIPTTIDRCVPRVAMEMDGTSKQLAIVEEIAKKFGFTRIQVVRDLYKRPRALFCY